MDGVLKNIEPNRLESGMAQNIWQLCLQHLERELPPEDFNTFIRPLEVANSKNKTRLVAPNPYIRDHISTHYLERIRDIFEHLDQPRETVVIVDGLPAEATDRDTNVRSADTS